MSDNNIIELKKEKYIELESCNALQDHYNKELNIFQATQLEFGQVLKTAGRLVSLRVMGKILFANLYDFSGTIQICVRKEEGDDSFDRFVNDVSIGDFIGVGGTLFLTKTEEKTIRVGEWALLNKAVRPFPDKYYGIENIELRYRQRALDLITNESSRNVFKKRFEIVKTLRRYLEDQGYIEVETPVLQNHPSGALARPFHTHHNALDIECSLRIACETYLKRCIGAGIDKVFEFARCFRNEGISHTHLQDFTMLEFYASYCNAESMRPFVEGLLRNLIEKVFGQTEVTIRGHVIQFGGEWPVLDYSELIYKDTGIDIRTSDTKPKLIAAMKENKVVVEDVATLSWTNLVDTIYKKYSRPKLIQPCFLVKYPVDMAPLARRNAQDKNFVDFFQFLIDGVEIVKAYSELVDPLDQRGRFESQAASREAGDEESLPMDEEYLQSMEHGFPPIAGVGIGIDRLVMVLCGCDNIKDTILFPLLRSIEK